MNLKVTFLMASCLIIASFTSLEALATLGKNPTALSNQKILKHSSYSTAETVPMDSSSPGIALVKEFVDSGNNVFAVCWNGQRPGKYISGLLGDHYNELYHDALKSASRRKGRRFLVAKSENFVLKTTRHGRNFKGCAYDSNLVPSGVNSDEIK